MELKRSYRRRGTPDLPMAVYIDTARVAGFHPIPEYHPELEIVRILKGHVVIQLSGVPNTFREGDIFIIPSNTVHHYRYMSKDVKYCSVIFSPDAISMQPEHFFQKSFVQPLAEGRIQLPSLLQPGHPAYDVVSTQFYLLMQCRIFTENYQFNRFSALMTICFALFPYCTVSSKSQAISAPGNDVVRLCMRYIHNQLASKITLEALAEHCHLHPNYLCALFKSYTGQTIFEYLARYRVDTAAQLLMTEDLPVAKVGELVGFQSESLFYRKFKEIMGVTPKAYARQHKK